MIKKTSQGYKVVSHTGRNLSSKNLTLEEAKRRLAEIEYFKHKANNGK